MGCTARRERKSRPTRAAPRRWLAALLVAPALTAPSAGVADGERFRACLAGLQERALAAGVPERPVREVLTTLEYQPRVIELDRAQPEFTQTFTAYLGARVTARRVAAGRALLMQHEPLLAGLAARYGVPPHYLVAIWGLESNFGGYLGAVPTLDALATLACDPRRAEFFIGELFTALRLLERERLAPEALRGSWAGAVGHTQFMPSAWYRHAVDGDGDGRIDLRGSIPDALASGAHYLRELGWRPGERWGREVRLPPAFPWEATGIGKRRSLEEWRALGVRRADGAPLPEGELEGAIIVPMGHAGPAFLVYPNFDVIMRWNRSQSYALAVGHLADRIAGAGGLVASLPPERTGPSRQQVRALQERLIAAGFEPGEPDGFLGPVTRAALRAFQHSRGLVADGYPDPGTLAALGVGTAGAPAASR